MKSFFLLKTHEINDYIFWYYICLKLIMTSKAISHVYIRYSINIIVNGDLHELMNNWFERWWLVQGISAIFTSKLTDIFNKRLQGVKTKKNNQFMNRLWLFLKGVREKQDEVVLFKKMSTSIFFYMNFQSIYGLLYACFLNI